MNEALDNAADCWDFRLNNWPRCPHCGNDCDPVDMEIGTEGSHVVECTHCDKPFTVVTSVAYYYSTDRQ